MSQKANNTLRMTFSLTLMFCFLQGVAVYKSVAGHYLFKNPKIVLLMSAFVGRVANTAISNRKHKLESSDEFFKDALVVERTSIDLIRVLSSFLTKACNPFVQSKGQNAIYTRAPPYSKF